VTTLAQWDEDAKGEIKGTVGGGRPTSSVVRTIEAAPLAGATTASTKGPTKK
jgi:hypothetical protein